MSEGLLALEKIDIYIEELEKPPPGHVCKQTNHYIFYPREANDRRQFEDAINVIWNVLKYVGNVMNLSVHEKCSAQIEQQIICVHCRRSQSIIDQREIVKSGIESVVLIFFAHWRFQFFA